MEKLGKTNRYVRRWKIVNLIGSMYKQSGWEYFEKLMSEQGRFGSEW